MTQWIGYMVSIKCFGDAGTFQGEITKATNTNISLSKAFCNGIPCPQNEVEIRAESIADIKLIEKLTSSPQQRSTITIAKPVAKRAGRTQSTSESTINKAATNNINNGSHSSNTNNGKTKPLDIELKINNIVDKNCNATPNKRDKTNKAPNKWTKGWPKDEEAFGSPVDSNMSKDFDFEKNLALFNKQAIWDKLNNAQKPDLVRQVDNKRTGKYRHDENVIASGPTTYRQITVPKQDFCEYVTDDGLIIPSISRSLRKKLWEVTDRAGLNWDRRIELVGRATTELTIQLCGGAHRLSPRNSHQWPTVVVLCGPNKQGAMGVNTARQLASHGVHTVVFTNFDTNTVDFVVKRELNLYKFSHHTIVNAISQLPNTVDIIILALCEDTDTPKTHQHLADWASKNKATVLALDPPVVGTPCFAPKCSLLPGLPLPHKEINGKLYLCNLGIPDYLFSEIGIRYKSPFGPKFVIPLHPKNE